MGLFDLVREEQEAKKKAEESAKEDVKDTVLKNAPNLTDREIALLCDGGNLCFGYRVEGNTICVYTD